MADLADQHSSHYPCFLLYNSDGNQHGSSQHSQHTAHGLGADLWFHLTNPAEKNRPIAPSSSKFMLYSIRKLYSGFK